MCVNIHVLFVTAITDICRILGECYISKVWHIIPTHYIWRDWLDIWTTTFSVGRNQTPTSTGSCKWCSIYRVCNLWTNHRQAMVGILLLHYNEWKSTINDVYVVHDLFTMAKCEDMMPVMHAIMIAGWHRVQQYNNSNNLMNTKLTS